MSIGDEVLELFDRHGWRAYSEQVCMAEHSTQAAALAPEACSSDALVLSNLLGRRDFGHRMTMRPGECRVLDNQRILHRREGKPTRLAVFRAAIWLGTGWRDVFPSGDS